MDRSSAANLALTFKVLNKEAFQATYYEDPFLASMLLSRFKQFLDDDFFEDVERQLILRAFLNNDYPLEVSFEITNFIKNESKLYSDYVKILLEWNYEASDKIRAELLSKYDGEYLGMSVYQKAKFDIFIAQQEAQRFEKMQKLIEKDKKNHGKKKD